MNKFKWGFAALVASISIGASANQIVLEGSDATALHHDAVYTSQLLTFMAGGSSLPVLIMGGRALSFSGPTPATLLLPGYSLAALPLGKTLADFSALYVESPGGCCTQDPTKISAADKALIGAAEGVPGAVGGLALTIENYGGGPGWGLMLPAAVNALPSSAFGGLTGYGTAGGPGCTDGEVFNATGLGFGFIQPPVLGCYEHQAYLTSAFTGLGAVFSGLGFVSLVDADLAYFTAGVNDGSALLALGGTLGRPKGVPEPGSMLLVGLGVAALAATRRRRNNS